MTNINNILSPTSDTDRIILLDVLRGFAVLGILIMNIQSFAMVGSTYLNPTSTGDLTGVNWWIWAGSHVFANQKFMTIFSLLFGAGILLFAEKIEAKGRRPAGIYYRRIFILIFIGLLHAYLLWYGDILFTYGVCGLFVYLFRKFKAKWLFTFGLLAISVHTLIYLSLNSTVPYMPNESLQELKAYREPSPVAIQAETQIYQSGWLTQMVHRIPSAIFFQTVIFLIWTGWRAGGLMLVGMALYKWGVLTGKLSSKTYLILFITNILIGFSTVIYGIIRNYAENWSLEYSFYMGTLPNEWGSLFVSFGYICLFCYLYPIIKDHIVTKSLANVGRLALTNYLMQTIICTTIFYGHGFGMFGQVNRIEQILIVLMIWVFQILISNMWVKHYRFGPFEWFWRTLTYWKVQPIYHTSIE